MNRFDDVNVFNGTVDGRRNTSQFDTSPAVGNGPVFDHLHVIINAEKIGHIADGAADFLRTGVDRIAADAGLAP